MPSNRELQDTDEPETDGKDVYSEMVQRSYDDLFEPWLKPDAAQESDPQPGASETPN